MSSSTTMRAGRSGVGEKYGSDAGRWAVAVGYPVGMGVLGSLVLLILGPRGGALSQEWFTTDMTVFWVYTVLLMPYSIGGGALEGVYGRRLSPVPCCGVVVTGAAIAYALPLVVVWLLGLYVLDGRIAAAVAAGVAIQIAVAVTAWAVVRRRNAA